MIIATATCPVVASAAGGDILRTTQTHRAIGFHFEDADQALLEQVQHACFQYFWKEVGSPAPLARDRKKAPVSSIASVGFQLAALPIGVKHKWITRDAGRRRAEHVLSALIARQDNKKYGVYVHFPDLNSGGLSHVGYEVVASTVDHALLAAGAMVAAEFFGDRVTALADRLLIDTNWKAYATRRDGFLSMGWKPKNPERIDGPGEFLKWNWHDASDEERLIYFLAVGSPNQTHALAPDVYYRLARPIKRHAEMKPYVVSWPGSLFTYIFSHCYIDYRSLGADDPKRFGVEAPRVDWFENSRRAVLTHRQRCIEQASRFKTLAEDRWGLSACAGRDGYIVPEVMPNIRDHDEWYAGTLAPYAAASAIMFTPRESMAAIRAFRSLKNGKGEPLVWRDPAKGGYGFVDAFNLDQGFASDDYVGIDQGPMLLAIENARTGLIWKLFMRHASARRAIKRLRLGE